MTRRLAIAALIYPTVNAVLFGAGLIAVLGVPVLSTYAMTLVPNVTVVSFLLARPSSWTIAPRLRARYWRGRGAPDEL